MKSEMSRQLGKHIVDATSARIEDLESVLIRIDEQVADCKKDDAGLTAIIESKNHCAGSISELKSARDAYDEPDSFEQVRSFARKISRCARNVQRAAYDIYRVDEPLFYRLYQPDDADLSGPDLYGTFQPYFADIYTLSERLTLDLEDILDEFDGLAEPSVASESPKVVEVVESDCHSGISHNTCEGGIAKAGGRPHSGQFVGVRGEALIAGALGANPNPDHLRNDPTALTAHRTRILENNFEIIEIPKAGRQVRKVVPVSVRHSGVDTQLYGSAAVSYQYFHHCLTEVTKSIEWLETEICECDEELVLTLRTQTIICFQMMVEEIRRPGGPIRHKVDLLYENLVGLIGSGKDIEGELICMLGIDVDRTSPGGSHRIELSHAMQERNSRSVIMLRRWGRSLYLALEELVDDCSAIWELPKVLQSTSNLVTQLKAEIECTGLSRTEVEGIEVVDWIDEMLVSEFTSHQVISELRGRELNEISQTAVRWLEMIDISIANDAIAAHPYLKSGFSRLRRYVQKTEMITHVASGDVKHAEGPEEKLA